MSIYEMPTSDDTLVWDVWLSHTHLPTVTVADELGILRSLYESPASIEELAERLGFDLRATKATLRLLAALGFLMVRLGQFQLTDQARLYLLKDSPFYWGHMIGGRSVQQHERLREILEGKSPAGRPGADGRPETGNSGGSIVNWSSGRIDRERAQHVAAAMQSHSLPAAIALAQNGDFRGVSKLLDVGGGSGCFAIALAREYPEMRCSVMELPAMCEVAQDYIREGEVVDRVDTVAVDMFRQTWPAAYDAHFFSNVWHDWDLTTCAWLAARSYDALPAGGRICLHEMLLDDDGAGPLTATSFSMLMLLGTQGQQFTLPELTQILESAGFVDVRAQHTYGYYSLVTASKL